MNFELTTPPPVPVEGTVTISMSETQARLLLDLVGAVGHNEIYEMFKHKGLVQTPLDINFTSVSHEQVSKFRQNTVDAIFHGLDDTIGAVEGGRRWSEIVKDLK